MTPGEMLGYALVLLAWGLGIAGLIVGGMAVVFRYRRKDADRWLP